MNPQQPFLSSESIQMIVSSVTNNGRATLTELEAERLLNAIARTQARVSPGPERGK